MAEVGLHHGLQLDFGLDQRPYCGGQQNGLASRELSDD